MRCEVLLVLCVAICFLGSITALPSTLVPTASTPVSLNCTNRVGGNGLSFFTIWTTPESTFNNRYMRSIESVFFHHPEANVTIYSTSLHSTFFNEFTTKGCNIHIEKIDIRTRAKGTPFEQWSKNIASHKKGPHYAVHLSDITRVLVLYNQGGTYFDTDAIFLKPISSLKNAISLEPHGVDYIGNALFVNWEPAHPFIFELMTHINNFYDPNDWGANGPRALSDVYYHSHTHDPNITLLPPSGFFPIDGWKIRDLFNRHTPSEIMETITPLYHDSYVLHYWNSLTKELPVAHGSTFERILNDQCILCHTLDDTDIPPIEKHSQ